MIAEQRQQRRALRTANKWCGIRLTLEDLAAIADRIQHHRDRDDVAFVGRISRRATRWRVRVGAGWYHVQYDTHRHAVEAFLNKESECPDVDAQAPVDLSQ
ncbi:MAG: hypothetical protein ACRD3G_11445 [Vicinamibacterales bacterium]